jgi:hypothetical protein
MKPLPEPRLVLTMRDAMVAVQRATRAKDKRAGLEAIKACWEAAKGFFAGDSESLASFRDRLQGIRDDLKAGNHDEAFQVAEFVRLQLHQLALGMAARGHLPEVVAELKRVLAGMTPFDHYVGRLCEETYRDYGSPDRTLMYGMLHILEYALAGGLEDGDTPESLLETKATQGEEPAAEVAVAGQVVELLLSAERWQELERTARSGGVPRVIILTTWLVQAIERLYARPVGIMPPGHYIVVGSFIFAAGLHMAATRPALGQELVNERREG